MSRSSLSARLAALEDATAQRQAEAAARFVTAAAGALGSLTSAERDALQGPPATLAEHAAWARAAELETAYNLVPLAEELERHGLDVHAVLAAAGWTRRP